MTSRHFCFSVNTNSGPLSGAERRSSARVTHSPTICTGNCPIKLQDLPGSRRSPCSALTSKWLRMRVHLFEPIGEGRDLGSIGGEI
jgi:hypothetical protein